MSEKVNVTVIKPQEGKWFEVNPLAITQKLFEERRDDPKQEKTRKLILKAFKEVTKNPKKYANPFHTRMREELACPKIPEHLKKHVEDRGNHVADWVEQSLEWAQRIHNGESWETLCNELDTANWYRLVIWKNEYRLVGGSRKFRDSYSASDINDLSNAIVTLEYTVALEVKVKPVLDVEIVPTPIEGKCFEVNPLAISQKLFEKKRKDSMQEQTRQLIQEAFTEVKNNPQKYGRTFLTVIPEKNWRVQRTVAEHKELAESLGDHMADWIEQSLEWAQRIHNGESWETLCNEPDTAKWFRIVIWKDGLGRLVGGSSKADDVYEHSRIGNNRPVSMVTPDGYGAGYCLFYSVPLVVLYK